MKTQVDFDAYAEALKKRFTDSAADLAKANGGNLSREDIFAHVDEALKKGFEQHGAKPNGDDGEGGTGGEGGGDMSPRVCMTWNATSRQNKDRHDRQTDPGTRRRFGGKSRDTTIRNTLVRSRNQSGRDARRGS